MFNERMILRSTRRFFVSKSHTMEKRKQVKDRAQCVGQIQLIMYLDSFTRMPTRIRAMPGKEDAEGVFGESQDVIL